MRPLPAPVKQQPVNSMPNTTPAPTPAADPSPNTKQQQPKPKLAKPQVRAPKAAPARPPAVPAPRPAAALPKNPPKPLKTEPKPEMRQATIQTHVTTLSLPSHTTTRVAARRNRDDNFTVRRERRRSLDLSPRIEAKEQRVIPARRLSQEAGSSLSLRRGSPSRSRVVMSVQQSEISSNLPLPWEADLHTHGKPDVAIHLQRRIVSSKAVGFSMGATEEAISPMISRRSSMDTERPSIIDLNRGHSYPDGDIPHGQSLETIFQAARPISAGRGTGQSCRPCSMGGAAPQGGPEERVFCGKAEAPQRKCLSEHLPRNGFKLPEISAVSPTCSSSTFSASSKSSPSTSSSSGDSTRASHSSSWGNAKTMAGSFYKSNSDISSMMPELDEPEEELLGRRKCCSGPRPSLGELEQNVGPTGLVSKSSDFGTGISVKPPLGGLSSSGKYSQSSPYTWAAQTNSHNNDVFSAWHRPATPIWDPTPDRCLPNTVFKPPSKSFNPSLAVLQACQGGEPHQKPRTGVSRSSTPAPQGGLQHNRGTTPSAAPSPRDAVSFGMASRGASRGPASPFAPGGGALVPSTRKLQKRRATIGY